MKVEKLRELEKETLIRMIVCLNRNQQVLRVDRDFERYLSSSIEQEYRKLKRRYNKLSRDILKGRPVVTDVEREYRDLIRRHDKLVIEFAKMKQHIVVAS